MVKPKTQPYMQLKLSGHGMPVTRATQYGDQIILLKPFIPDIISDDVIQSILRSK
jgi:DnaJ-class molecular chaperone